MNDPAGQPLIRILPLPAALRQEAALSTEWVERLAHLITMIEESHTATAANAKRGKIKMNEHQINATVDRVAVLTKQLHHQKQESEYLQKPDLLPLTATVSFCCVTTSSNQEPKYVRIEMSTSENPDTFAALLQMCRDADLQQRVLKTIERNRLLVTLAEIGQE